MNQTRTFQPRSNPRRNADPNAKPAYVPPTTEQVAISVSVLNRSFREATLSLKSRLGKSSNVAGTPLYEYQVEFAYIIDKIQRGPLFFAVMYIAEANDLIKKVEAHQKA